MQTCIFLFMQGTNLIIVSYYENIKTYNNISCACKYNYKTTKERICMNVVYPGCTSGDMRLAGSSSSSTQGRVELCHNNQWGTICDDGWDNSDAEVACKQLKYSSYSKDYQITVSLNFDYCRNDNLVGAQNESNAAFGQGSGSIWLSDVGCDGTEGRLLECSTGTVGGHTCSHSDDAGVTCSTC